MNAYFAAIFQDICGEQRVQRIQNKKWGHCDCAGTPRMLISHVTWALIIINTSEKGCGPVKSYDDVAVRQLGKSRVNSSNLLLSLQQSF
jgi:hypothetical protein